MDIKKEVENIKEYIIEKRREFHRFPEPSWQEYKTSEKIKRELEKMKIPFKPIGKTGIIAEIKGDKKGKKIALRADIDALEIEELNDIEYKSEKKGLMHACGHDGHMAMLLGAAKILKKHEHKIKGTIKLIFQPAEELGNGAKEIIASGEIDDIDNIFGLHLWSGIPTEKIGVKEGEQMASADLFRINIKGKGGHGSLPHQGVDAALVSSAIIMNLQSIVSREITPLDTIVVSVGKIKAGTRYNIIAHEGIIEGTVRCFNNEIRRTIPERIKRIAENTAKTYRAKASLEYDFGPPPLINEETSVELAKESIKKLFGENAFLYIGKITAAEDFAYYLEKIPGVFVFVGSGNNKKKTDFPHHHPMFNIDEDSLLIGTALHIRYSFDFLNN
jgi:amidohydrolase